LFSFWISICQTRGFFLSLKMKSLNQILNSSFLCYNCQIQFFCYWTLLCHMNNLKMKLGFLNCPNNHARSNNGTKIFKMMLRRWWYYHMLDVLSLINMKSHSKDALKDWTMTNTIVWSNPSKGVVATSVGWKGGLIL